MGRLSVVGRSPLADARSVTPRRLSEKQISTADATATQAVGSATSPFGYFGSKLRLAAQIAEILPPHNAWVEAFCGSAAVTLVKAPAPIEIINDADNQIVNLFKQLREHEAELCRLIRLTPYAREEFERVQSGPAVLDGLERARRFLVASMMTINGAVGSNREGLKHSGFSCSQSYARGGEEARVHRWNGLPERLRKVVQRLKRVRVENMDARELLAIFLNRPATLVYLDPPYLIDRDHGYRVDANEEAFHEELLRLCCKTKCMILISGYDNPLYRSFLTRHRGWKRITIDARTRDTFGKDLARTEVLWQNHQFVKAAKTGRVPIRLTAKERADCKVNPVRK